MMFGMLDWSETPAADQALRDAVATLHPGIRADLVSLATPRLSLTGIRPVAPAGSAPGHHAADTGGLRSWDGSRSWLLVDAPVSAGAIHPDDLTLAASDHAGAARNIARGLRGDYAVAWWDARERALVLIRDAMGLRPLFFHHSPRRLAFSTSLAALRAALPGPRDLDHVFIAHMLCLDTEVGARTGWQDFQRVLAGGLAVLAPGLPRTRTRRWWRPEPETESTRPRDGDWPAALREKLLCAVSDRLPEAPGSVIASYLSGGLDSSSIVGAVRAVTRDRGTRPPIHTLSFRFPGLQGREQRQSDETRYQDAVNAFVDATPHPIRADLSSPLHDLDRFLEATGEPWVVPNRYLHQAGLRVASELGASVVFDGIDGDSAIGDGVERLEALARSLRWVQLLRQARRFARSVPGRQRTVTGVLRQHALPGLLPLSWRRRKAIARGEQRLRLAMELLSPALRDRDDVRQDLRPQTLLAGKGGRSPVSRHAAGLRLGIFELATSQLQRLAMSYGLRVAFPFFDRELLELSLAAPLDQKLRDGWSRHILREAMAGLVPDEVRWRRGKAYLGAQFYRGLLTTDRPFARALLRRTEPFLEPYVDIAALRRASHDLFERQDRSQAMPLLAVITLARWLELCDEGVV